MPCLEVTLPKVEAGVKATLAKELTTAFCSATGFPVEIFGILFREYEYGRAASGGEICSDSDTRPYLHMVLYCPRLKRSAKQKVVKSLTESFCSVVGRIEWRPVLHICEHPYDNVGVDGKLLSDSFEQCREAEFYYPLTED
ncbi:MAG: hypothetical protein P1R58_06930 [bacterium]|nr:hypothetical protein [bacterium]